jgi:hypothetical protein
VRATALTEYSVNNERGSNADSTFDGNAGLARIVILSLPSLVVVWYALGMHYPQPKKEDVMGGINANWYGVGINDNDGTSALARVTSPMI